MKLIVKYFNSNLQTQIGLLVSVSHYKNLFNLTWSESKFKKIRMNEYCTVNSRLISDFVKLTLISLEQWFIIIINLSCLFCLLNLQNTSVPQNATLTGTISKGPFKNEITNVGGGVYPKFVTRSDIGRRVVHANSNIINKNILYKFLFFNFLLV